GRNPDWVARPFFAKYNPHAIWISDLEPTFGDRFFFEEEDQSMFHEDYHQDDPESFE
ncbi:lysine 2,3-aminomutase, partial [bacterium]